MAGLERRNNIVVVSMGQNEMRGHVHREGLDGTDDGNEAWRTAQWRKQTSYVRNGVLLIGRGLAYSKTKKKDLLWSKRGSCFERGWSNARPFPPFCGTPGLVSIACSVQALPMNTTAHSVPTQPIGSHAFRCLPMNTTHSVASP